MRITVGILALLPRASQGVPQMVHPIPWRLE